MTVDFVSNALVYACLIMSFAIGISKLLAYRRIAKWDYIERHEELYISIKEFLANVVASGKVSDVELARFRKISRGNELKFSNKLNKLTNKNIILPVLKLRAIQEELPGIGIGSRRRHLVKEKAKILNKLEHEFHHVDKYFKPLVY